MDFDTFGAPLGGSHEHHWFPESGDRLRYIKSAQQANAKWVASTSVGTETWASNLNATQKPITQAAVNARGKMQANWNAATAPGGTWERNLLAKGDGYVKSQAVKLKQHYSDGVRDASDKQLASITKILAYESAGLSTLTPKSGTGSGRTRMNEWFDYMSAGRGTLGA